MGRVNRTHQNIYIQVIINVRVTTKKTGVLQMVDYVKCVFCGEEYPDYLDVCPNCQTWTYENESFNLPLDDECYI